MKSKRILYKSHTPKNQVLRSLSKNTHSQSDKHSSHKSSTSRLKPKYTTYNKRIANLDSSDIKLKLPKLENTHKLKESIENRSPVSNKNKILIQNLIKKLNTVEQFAIHKPEVNQQYIQLLHSLTRRQEDYKDLLNRKAKRFDSNSQKKLEELDVHFSPVNNKVNRQAISDMRKVRNFADKHKILLYRKNEISPVNNLHELKGVAPIKKLKYSKSTHVNPYQTDEEMQIKEGSLDVSSYLQQQSLRRNLSKRQSLNSKDRHTLGVSYLKNSSKNGRYEKSLEQSATKKIRLVKEIIHHWKVDNRYLHKSTYDDPVDQYPQQKM